MPTKKSQKQLEPTEFRNTASSNPLHDLRLCNKKRHNVSNDTDKANSSQPKR